MVDKEPTGESREPLTLELVETLAQTARNSDGSYPERHNAVMRLWHATLEADEELHEPAIRALSDVAWDDSHRGLASQAQDRLDRISKEAPDGSVARKLAWQAIRHEL